LEHVPEHLMSIRLALATAAVGVNVVGCSVAASPNRK
jgi:hypothetical protein